MRWFHSQNFLYSNQEVRRSWHFEASWGCKFWGVGHTLQSNLLSTEISFFVHFIRKHSACWMKCFLQGRYKTWTHVYGLDYGLDYGLNFWLDFGVVELLFKKDFECWIAPWVEDWFNRKNRHVATCTSKTGWLVGSSHHSVLTACQLSWLAGSCKLMLNVSFR